MRVLIIGAGVIGCYLTHVLCGAGQDVTLLARGRWREQLAQNGLRIEHRLQKKETVDRPRMIETIARDEDYDAVFVVMQHQQLWNVLEDVARIDTPLVVLVGNNMSAPEMQEFVHKHEVTTRTVLFGFQGTAGRREDARAICVHWGNGSMTIGAVRGAVPAQAKTRVEALFAGTGYRLTWSENMEAWYQCHLALILPASYLCYALGCDLRKASRAQRRRLLDAAAEGMGLLKALGTPIMPPGNEKYYQPGVKRLTMAAMIFVMAKTVLGDLAAADHCRHAVSELEGLDCAFEKLRSACKNFPMPAWNALRADKPEWTLLHRLYDQ